MKPMLSQAIGLSIVIPAYNEEGNLIKIYEELLNILSSLDMGWEIIFVDDGSKDNTWQTILSLHHKDNNIKGVQLSRNFGHQYALFAGLSTAKGQVIISMDADLQHPPKIIPKLIDEWKKGNKIVNTIRIDVGKLSLYKKMTSKLFYWIFSFLSGVHIEKGMADFRLIDRQVLNQILQFGEQGLFLRGMIQWVGYPTSKVIFQSPDRYSGSTKYSFKKMIFFAIDGITSFSLVPLRLGIIIGVVTSFIAFWQMAYAIYAKVILGVTVAGWATTITVISFMFGILFVLLGLIGEYIGRILIETRARPRYIINEQVGLSENKKI